jgi:hypothetical protein
MIELAQVSEAVHCHMPVPETGAFVLSATSPEGLDGIRTRGVCTLLRSGRELFDFRFRYHGIDGIGEKPSQTINAEV